VIASPLEAACDEVTSMNAMNRNSRTQGLRRLVHALAWSAIVLPSLSLANPPPWAPAHGWRAKSDPSYAGYSGRDWDHDYGVRSGRCDREEVGALLGGIAGGAVGAAAGKEGNRAVAIVVGSVVGAAVGAEIGRRMDQTDRACTGHSLELAATGRSVTWRNVKTGVTYQLTPIDTGTPGTGCRKFKLTATGAFGLSEGRATACPGGDAVWNLAPETRVSQR
jgi:surface antigen